MGLCSQGRVAVLDEPFLRFPYSRSVGAGAQGRKHVDSTGLDDLVVAEDYAEARGGTQHGVGGLPRESVPDSTEQYGCAHSAEVHGVESRLGHRTRVALASSGQEKTRALRGRRPNGQTTTCWSSGEAAR